MDAARILIVDDEPAMLENCARILEAKGYTCCGLDDARRFRAVAEEFAPDLVVTDLRMPGADGMTILAVAVADDPARPVIIMTAHASVAAAVAAVREGAFDFITKPFTADELLVAVDRAVRYRGLTVENRALRSQVARTVRGEGILGSSSMMAHLRDQITLVAPTDASVLLTGESGTGKELIARSLHARSPRSERPFVPVDCAAMPEGLMESELFGHRRGAFTGAVQSREGLLAQARGGTVFLDEIGELPLPLQAKLLRVLEQRQMRPLGESRLVDLDIRVVSATNRNIEDDVAAGRFREDLFYRLNVISIRLPALRERPQDLVLLFNTFLTEFALLAHRRSPRVTAEAWTLLERYPWPGNVRELRNVAHRLVVLDTDGQVAPAHLPAGLREPVALLGGADEAWPLAYEAARESAHRAFLTKYIAQMLESSGGNVSRAADVAGVSRRTFHRWMAELRGEVVALEEDA